MQHSIKTIYSLQALRYIAAILIVGYHAEESIKDRISLDMMNFFSFGDIGVDIFFVISGFIIAFATSKSYVTSPKKQAQDFIVRRFIRIVPIYWFYTTLKIIMVLALPTLALRTQFDEYHIFTSYFFIPSMSPWGLMQPILPVGWTLHFEMLFYLIFTIAILVNQNKIAITGIAFFLLFAINYVYPDLLIFKFYAQTIIFEFLLGLMVFKIVSHIHQLNFIPTILLAIVSILLISTKTPEINRIFTIGLGSAFLVLSFIYFERFLTSSNIQKISEKLGDSSYSLYLSHSFTVPFSVILLGKYLSLNVYIVLALTLVIATMAGLFSYRFLEKPTITFLNTKWRVHKNKIRDEA